MKYHIYVTPHEFSCQISTVVEYDGLPSSDFINLPYSDLHIILTGLIDGQLKKYRELKNYQIDGLREFSSHPLPPTPCWKYSSFLENSINDYAPYLGNESIFLWRSFLEQVLSCQWIKPREWVLDSNGFGFPFPTSHSKFRPLACLPMGWEQHVVSNAHLRYVHASACPPIDMQNFLVYPMKFSTVFPATTHPLFYVALYEFWEYLREQPLWLHNPGYARCLDDDSSVSGPFSNTFIYSLGLQSSPIRHAWWSFVNNVFAMNTRARSILKEYRPDVMLGKSIGLPTTDFDLSPEISALPPPYRVFSKPFYL